MNTVGTFGEQWGRLGNQLFQLGLLFAIRERQGQEFWLPHNGESLWECFDLDVPADGPLCRHRFDETRGSCNYDPGVFEQPDGTSYHGYFQSYRYLEACGEALKRFLRFRFPHRARSEAALYGYRRRYGLPLVSLHVRRGDYALPEAEHIWGNLANDGYYRRVVKTIGGGAAYLVFSDDLDWCRQSIDVEPVEFADFDPFTSLCLMTCCDVNVVANSSFSWWGAFLNRYSEVYAPTPWWLGMPPPNDRQDDILPPSWRAVPVFERAPETSRAPVPEPEPDAEAVPGPPP